jgi:RimJ/RimL family protein N-acetyltransferase
VASWIGEIDKTEFHSAVEVPVIETERLLMRGHRPDDFLDCAAMWGDPVVTRYIGGKPFSKEDVWARILRYVGHWSWMGFGHWAVEEKATGSFVGEVGFADFKRDIEPSVGNIPEIGWVLATRMRGKGYATEAVRAATAWGDLRFGPTRTVCLIHADNLASIRVAEKCGYQEYQRTIYRSQPTVLLAREGRRNSPSRAD